MKINNTDFNTEYDDHLNYLKSLGLVKEFKMEVDIDLTKVDIDFLGNVYAESIHNENYEQADLIKNELLRRKCNVIFDFKENSKNGIIHINCNI